MYNEHFLHCVRMTEKEDTIFIKARCAAEMRKKVVYEIDVSLDQYGVILECQCDCGAGMGPSAHCKHVCAALFGLIEFSDSKHIKFRASCTSKLQTFHHTKQFTGSPLKASTLKIRNHEGATSLSQKRSFDPRPPKYRNRSEYPAEFRNKCINFASSTSMPITHIYPPANPYAVARDHDYMKETPEDTFLRNIHVTDIDNAEIRRIEQSTKGQSTNPAWYDERSIRLSSSRFGRICKATQRTDFRALANSFTKVTQIKNKAIDHGLRYEPVAIRKYESETGTKITDCGVFVCSDVPFLAASPDRTVDDDLLVEVKCPYSAKDNLITKETVPYLEDASGSLTLRTDHDYYYQVQGQLLCTGRKECDFVVYTLKDIKIMRICRDEGFIADMKAKLTNFF